MQSEEDPRVRVVYVEDRRRKRRARRSVGKPKEVVAYSGRPDQGEPNPNPRREALIPC